MSVSSRSMSSDEKELPKGCAWTILAVVLIVVGMWAWGAFFVDDAPEGTNPDTIARIESLTDCDALHMEFDRFDAIADGAEVGSSRRAAANHYLIVTGNRMEKLGC